MSSKFSTSSAAPGSFYRGREGGGGGGGGGESEREGNINELTHYKPTSAMQTKAYNIHPHP